MALNFPNSPALNEIYAVGGVTYVWDGVKWTSKGAASGNPLQPDEDGNVVITGTLTVNGSTITANSADLSGNLNVAGDIDND